MELRAARPAELNDLIALQCVTFSLTREEWGAEPKRTAASMQNYRVASLDGKLVSCLTIEPQKARIGSATVTVGCIRRVATLPEMRNRGYASALMRDALAQMRRRGLEASALFPFSFSYYRKFGYELAGNYCHFWSRPHNLPSYVESRACRPGTPEDISQLARVYDRRSRRRACSLVREEKRWAHWMNGGGYQVVVYDSGNVHGYVIAREAPDSYHGHVLQIMELEAEHVAARRGLLGYLSRCQADSIEWYAAVSDVEESGLMRTPAPLREGFRPRGIATIRPMFQFRVVHLTNALKARAAQFRDEEAELTLEIRDELLPQNGRPVVVSSHDGVVQIQAHHRSALHLSLDIRTFSQMYCGYLGAAEAASLGLIEASDPEALHVAEQWFPALDPFIPEIERF